MSIEPGQLYLIRNKLASGLYLTLSQGDQKSIIGEDEGSGTAESQTWIIEFISEGLAVIKSQENNLYIGFEGEPEEGKKLIVGKRDHIARFWLIEPEWAGSAYYQIRLHINPSLVMEFPSANPEPGTHARLGRKHLQGDNQVWVPVKVE
jgi:hypothetical protein